MNQYGVKAPKGQQRTKKGWVAFYDAVKRLRESQGSQAAHRERRRESAVEDARMKLGLPARRYG